MNTKYLCDTNILLEVLHRRKYAIKCQKFLEKHLSSIALTDFSLFSLCILAKKSGNLEKMHRFIIYLLEQGMKVISTSTSIKLSILVESKNSSLDFDDYLQYYQAREHNLTLLTLDRDFTAAKLDIRIERPL